MIIRCYNSDRTAQRKPYQHRTLLYKIGLAVQHAVERAETPAVLECYSEKDLRRLTS